MLDLSPTKLVVIFVVVVVLLGPKRLPEVARQLGAGWRKLRELHGHLDRELRQTMPDLPSSQEIVRFARSPITLLNQLADRTGGPAEGGGSGADAGHNGGGPAGRSASARTRLPAGASSPAGLGAASSPAGLGTASSPAGLGTDDPNLN